MILTQIIQLAPKSAADAPVVAQKLQCMDDLRFVFAGARHKANIPNQFFTPCLKQLFKRQCTAAGELI